MREKEHGRPYDRDLFDRQVAEAVTETVRRQHEAGIDVVNDGEQGKASFFTYVVERLTGYSSDDAEAVLPPSWQREIDAYPDFYDTYFNKYTETVVPLQTMACVGPVEYKGQEAIATDIANLRAAIEAAVGNEGGPTEAFIPATSPRGFGRNAYYNSEREYLEAVAEALREEYLAIIDAGFLLQIDDPWLIEIMTGAPDSDPDERMRTANEHVEIVNHSLRDIPTENIRLHTCYGLNAGPRTHDLDLAEIGPMMLKIRAGGYSFEVANPRHYHEWKIWSDDQLGSQLGDDQVLIPGFLGHATPLCRAPGADRRRNLQLRLARRAGTGDRRSRLRLLVESQLRSRDSRRGGVGEVPGPR